MSQPARVGAAPVSAAKTSYRGLILFWAVVVMVLGSGAIVLQALGPLPPKPAAVMGPEIVPYPGTSAVRRADPSAAEGGAQSAPDATGAAPAAWHGIPQPDPALEEPAADFPGRNLPQIGQGDRAPMSVYAAPFDAADKHPRVALVIDGAGLDQDQTLHLLRDLPGAVDVAFSAYMPETLEDQFAATARQTNHECLQSIPMEPSGFPLSEEGARALLTGADAEQNRQNLEWALSRMPGCVGATGASDGLMGERFAQTGQGFADVLAEASKRGLLYLDPRTGAPALAGPNAGNARVVDMKVDQSPNAEEPVTAEMIDQRLAALERLATERGGAIGLAGPPKPVMLERIAVWAHGLAARGVTLVPLTAMPAPPKPAGADSPE